MLVVNAPELYPYILIGIAANCMAATIIAVWVAFQRPKYFTPEFMKQFEAEHKAAYPEGELDGGGNPDAGNGWYSR